MNNFKFIIRGLISSIILIGTVTVVKAKEVEKPNIVFILIDDQDLDEISTYGGKVYTPNMDRLANEGIKFNHAYVSSTVCTPSRYSFLTGRYAGSSYSKIYEKEAPKGMQGIPGFNVALENDKMNVAQVLSEAGYTTGFVGKYHLTSEMDQPEMFEGDNAPVEIIKVKSKKELPTIEASKAFAHNEAWGRKYLQYMGFDWAKNIYEGNINKPFSAHNPEWTTTAALEFLDEHKDQPFFLQYCPTLLHGPDNEWVRSYDFPDYTAAGEIKADPWVMEQRRLLRKKLTELGYDAQSGAWGCAWIDAMLGKILDKLDELGIAENTLVIFAPDHGSTDKASLYNINGTQIPLLMRWPKGIPAGIESDALVQNIDLAPTYFELAEAAIPENYHIDGQSLAPLFKNGKTKGWREVLYFELGGARAVMTHDWKYISLRYSKEQTSKIQSASPENLPKLMSPLQRLGIGVRGADHPGFWDEDQLYYIIEDPDEMINLAYDANYEQNLAQMRAMMIKHINKIGRPYGEFNLTGNAAPKGLVNKQIEMVKQIKVKGKKVTVPEHMK